MNIEYENAKHGHKLKPCPHCGSPAKFEDGGYGCIRIVCTNYEKCRKLHRNQSAEQLIAPWNTRFMAQPNAEGQFSAERR